MHEGITTNLRELALNFYSDSLDASERREPASGEPLILEVKEDEMLFSHFVFMVNSQAASEASAANDHPLGGE